MNCADPIPRSIPGCPGLGSLLPQLFAFYDYFRYGTSTLTEPAFRLVGDGEILNTIGGGDPNVSGVRGPARGLRASAGRCPVGRCPGNVRMGPIVGAARRPDLPGPLRTIIGEWTRNE